MKSLISDKTLWDSEGNKCRIEMYQIGENLFEIYFHDFNDAIPKRFVGPLGICMTKGDHWIAAKEKAGFISPFSPCHNAVIV